MSDRRPTDPVDVLLVEDNPGDVRIVEKAFEEGNGACTLHVVTDGDEALDFCHRRGDHADAPRPGIVLLDFNLPRTNGDEVLEELLADPELRSIPVVVLSGSGTRDDVATAYGLGANAYLSKPVDPDEFIEAIHAIESFWLATARLPTVDG